MRMSIRYCSVSLIIMLASALLSIYGQERVRVGTGRDQHNLVWNERPGDSLFLEDERTVTGEPSDGLIYKDKDFAVSLSQPMSFDRAGAYFVWWVRLEKEPGLRMVCFRRVAGTQRYLAASLGELEDLGKLKLVRARSGARLLFAVAGDGQLRIVSITNASGQRLLIDYTAAGQIENLRDGVAREAKPEYDGQQVRAVLLTWYKDGSKYLTMSKLK